MARIAKAKNCPFCSSSDSFVECLDYGEFAVICNECSARGPSSEGSGCDPEDENYRGRRNAIRAWNGRKRSALATPTPKEESK